MPATGQFVKQLFVERLVPVSGSHRQEYVAANVFVNDLAVGSQTLERNVLIAFERDEHLFDFPVDTPRLDGLVAPGSHHVATVQVHPHHTIERYAKKVLTKSNNDCITMAPETRSQLELI